MPMSRKNISRCLGAFAASGFNFRWEKGPGIERKHDSQLQALGRIKGPSIEPKCE